MALLAQVGRGVFLENSVLRIISLVLVRVFIGGRGGVCVPGTGLSQGVVV